MVKSNLNENNQIDDMHETEAFDKCLKNLVPRGKHNQIPNKELKKKKKKGKLYKARG